MSYRVPLVKLRTRALHTHLLPAGSADGLAFFFSTVYIACNPLSFRGRATELWC